MKIFLNTGFVFTKILTISLFFITQNLFANKLHEQEFENISDYNKSLLNNIKNKQEACEALNNKLVSFIDSIFYVKKCTLRPITDPDIANRLMLENKKHMFTLDSKIFSMIPMGNDYTYNEFYSEYQQEYNNRAICAQYEKNTVTIDNVNFYYIENCKKRLFKQYSDIEQFLGKSKPIYSIPPQIFKLFPQGENILISKKDTSKDNNLTESQLIKKLPPTQELCRNLERRVTSFHDSFFFVENCKLYNIEDFNLHVQQKADAHGGIKELSIIQALGIPRAGNIKSNAVLLKMK